MIACRHGVRLSVSSGRALEMYEPRQPSHGALYQIVRDHFETFRSGTARGCRGSSEQEFLDFLERVWLAGGVYANAGKAGRSTSAGASWRGIALGLDVRARLCERNMLLPSSLGCRWRRIRSAALSDRDTRGVFRRVSNPRRIPDIRLCTGEFVANTLVHYGGRAASIALISRLTIPLMHSDAMPAGEVLSPRLGEIVMPASQVIRFSGWVDFPAIRGDDDLGSNRNRHLDEYRQRHAKCQRHCGRRAQLATPGLTAQRGVSC